MVGTYVDDGALAEGGPVVVCDEVLDLVAGSLGEVAHRETEDTGAVGVLGEVLEDGLAVESEGEAGVALLAAVRRLDELLDGVDGGRGPLLEGHVEPVADAGSIEESDGAGSVGNDAGRDLLEDVVDGGVADESHDEGLLEAGLLGDLGEGGGAVDRDGFREAEVHDGVEGDVVIVLVPCLPPQILSGTEGKGLEILCGLEESDAGSLEVLVGGGDGKLARGVDLEAGQRQVVALDVVGELLSLGGGNSRKLGEGRHFVYGYQTSR